MKDLNDLEKAFLDLVDGLWRADELVEKTGLSEDRANEIWKIVEELRAK